jgi:HemX protein
MILLGFALQTAFLGLRGHALGRCPLTNLFEVLVFLAWSIALIYMVIGPAYRLSLMGAFTAPLVFALQSGALLAPIDAAGTVRLLPNAWLEFHASISLIAYGAFALACVAGIMYLVQERQLKTHAFHSIFYQLPPLPNLFSAMTRLLWLGFALYSAGLISGFFTGEPLPHMKVMLALAIWIIYAVILLGPRLRSVAPRRIAAFCIGAFAAALSVLWSIEFVAHHA